MITYYLLLLALLILGGLLCYRGIKIYKFAQMLLCGALGGLIGLYLVSLFERQEFYILALIFTVVGGFLGYKYYKVSLYICVVISTFAVTFSYFWKQAVAKATQTVADIVLTKNVLVDNMSGVTSLQGALDSFDVIMGIRNNNWATVFKESGDILKHGFFISLAVAVVAGLLVKLIGDYVIMAVSAAFGAMMLATMIEMFATISPMMHLLLLVVIGLSGIIVQYNTCGKKRR